MKITYRADAPLVQVSTAVDDVGYVWDRGQTRDLPDEQAAQLLRNPHFVAGESTPPAAAVAPPEPPQAPAPPPPVEAQNAAADAHDDHEHAG